MKWTDPQQAAIDARNDSVLVSAAAGSGKTAVLVARVVKLLEEGGSIDRMLIVTFTRAAAAEMRQRITAALEQAGQDNPHLYRQVLRIGRADICTLHVFCQRLIKEHFQAIGIDPLARIGDTPTVDALWKKAMDDVLEDAYAAPTPEEQALFAQFEDEQIVEMIGKLHKFVMARENPWQWLQQQCEDVTEESLKNSLWMEFLYDACALQLDGCAELLEQCRFLLEQPGTPQRYAKTFEQDMELQKLLQKEVENRQLTGGETTVTPLARGKKIEGEDDEAAARYANLRNMWKDSIRAARALLPEDTFAAALDIAHTLPPLRALCSLTERVDTRFFVLKQQRNLLDYHDLEQLALKALQEETVQKAVAAKYDALFIDEYQDVSGVQEAILRAIHQNSMLFLVGDVKQSIYRFRLADPTLFLHKYRTFSEDAAAPHRKILLSQNFRSCSNVLAAVNHVFVRAMRKNATELEYGEDEMLRGGDAAQSGAPVELHLITKEEDGEGELKKSYLYEAALAAQAISRLIRTESIVDKGVQRPLRYRDIAILLRNASSHAAKIAKVLTDAGIPVYSDATTQYFDLPEVTDMLNLLQVLDNPQQDIPLLSTLRCPCFGFAEEELARIRLTLQGGNVSFYQAVERAAQGQNALGERVRTAIEQLDTWRFLSRQLPVDELIWTLLEETGLYMRAGAQPEGTLRQANLRLLAERAEGSDAQRGLHAFLSSVEIARGGDDGRTAKALGENEDVVRIMTMHKSKGLEFPVVLLLELGSRFKKDSDNEPLLCDAEAGLALTYLDAEQRIFRQTVAKTAIQQKKIRDQRAEEARLLYVAMTRARERLLLMAAPKSLDRCMLRWQMPPSDYAAGSAACMLDWVAGSVSPALGSMEDCTYRGENGSVWQICWHSGELLEEPEESAAAPSLVFDLNPPSDKISRRMERVNPPQPPLKTSVSAMAKRIRAAGDTDENAEDKRVPQNDTLVSAPRFMLAETITGAQRGTLAHKALGAVDYALVRENRWQETLECLTGRGIVQPDELPFLRMDDVRAFFASPIGQRARNAADVRREWPFVLRADQHTLVQGILDMAFMEDDAWVLVDYKTDHATPEEISQRYQDQMRWYATALQRITGQPVKEIILYGLHEHIMITM